jgi:diguanylate cyclase (GGDEF)-like protein/PAS domain S-box-containing protein
MNKLSAGPQAKSLPVEAGRADACAALEQLGAPLLMLNPELLIIAINAQCQALLARLSGRHIECGQALSVLPIHVESGGDALGALCLQAFERGAFHVVGLCAGTRGSCSLLLRFTPLLDALGRSLMLTITIQEFPCELAGDAAGAAPQAACDGWQRSFDSAPAGIAHVAPNGRWLRVNQALCAMLGYRREELTALTRQDVTHPADLAAETALARQALDGERSSYVLEQRYLRKDGSPVWVYLAASLQRDRNGSPGYFAIVASDIDRDRQVLKAGQESRARLEAVFDSLNEAVFVFDANGRVVDANAAGLRLFSYRDIADADASVRELDQRFDACKLDGQPLGVEQWPIFRILRGARIVNEELQIRHRASGKKWIASFSGSRTLDRHGYPELSVLTIRDITKRHYAEVSLRVSEERLRTAFDHIPDAVVLYDRELRIRYVNHALSETVRSPASALLGRVDADIRDDSMAQLRRALLHDAASAQAAQKRDAQYASPHGMRYVTVTCVPLLDARGYAEEFMCVCHDYTERKHAEERARQAALHDPLTQLPNRALLFEYARHILSRARRSGEKAAVLFIDLDRFKPINDLHGHEAGDAVLRQIAQRFGARVREEDMVFRLGGDEFLILLSRIRDVGAVRDMAGHLVETISRPYHVGNLKLSVSASIGISLYPDDGEEIDTLINHADAAMYQAKQRGRNNYQVYAPEMSAHVERQAVIEQELKRAIGQHEFCLFYQPVMDMQTRRATCVEALIRWPGNSASAEVFVPIAEATGLIGPVGNWVFSEACRQYRQWREQGIAAVPIAINVSPVQFRRHDLAEYIEATLRHYGLDSSAIQLELTETAVMDDIDRAVDVLERLKAAGIMISLDDFGTGYSSLNYLSRLPLNKLKIDQTFVQRIDQDRAGRAITEAVIVLGRTLGLSVVAEGIESEMVLDYLRERGCNEGQGYFICEPLPGQAVAEWLKKHGLHG